MRPDRWLTVIFALLLLSTGCSRRSPEQLGLARPLRVVATTTIVADIVHEIGKDQIELRVLLPYGADPHSYELTPSDLREVTDADLIFVNGLGLEPFLDAMVQQSGTKAAVISVSQGIRARRFTEMASYNRLSPEQIRGQFDLDSPAGTVPDPDLPSLNDPHVWTNPHNVMVWVANIQEALSKRDIANAQRYATNAQWYKTKLIDLDGQIMTRIETIPPLNRHLVCDHLFLGYFADRYGFTQMGAIMPSADPMSGPSAKQLASLEELIRRIKVPTIFTGSPINETVAQRIADDMHVEVRRLYAGSLAETGRASTYMDYMEYNLEQIIAGLTPRPMKPSDPTRPPGFSGE